MLIPGYGQENTSGSFSVRKNNKWAHGTVRLEIPPLSSELQGQTGCLFQEAVFDLDVGNEVYLLVLEDSQFGPAVAATRPFRVLCTTGLIRTTHGLVVFLVWTVAQDSPNETQYEQFLNPNSIEAIRLLSAAGLQSHLKVVIVDTLSSAVLDYFEFENVYGFDRVVEVAASSIGHEPVSDFALAQQEVVSQYSMEDLLNM